MFLAESISTPEAAVVIAIVFSVAYIVGKLYRD